MSEVRKWLEGIGLGQYADAFESNEIGMELLRQVDDQMLKDIGISTGGHRLRIRGAIAKLTAASTVQASENITATKTEPARLAERRQLTVMFCDLVGSTALSARLDPEDMREIIVAYHRCCAEQITKAGGFVAKYMGDGVLAYFGYPQAHEEDAERAVRAALILIDAVQGLQSGPDTSLQVRIGIATGLVVVGDLIGTGAAQEQGVVGETPNVAARLQTRAEPAQVVISNSTRLLTGGMFEYRDLGRVTLRGLGVPVQAWLVMGASRIESRFEAQHGTSLTPLVGREEELELLFRRWRQAVSGEGRVVLLSGEPGIGKSRLTVALQERLQGEPHTRVRYFCSPHHTDSAFYSVIAQLERAAGFERHDTVEAKFDKLKSLLALSSDHERDIVLLAELLSIPTVDRYAPLDWSAQRKKNEIFRALLRQLEMLSRQRPVLIVYEDAHWSDPSTRELLDISIERVARLPVLLVVTFRPEFQPPWIGQAHVAALSLNRLGRREAEALVGAVAGETAIPCDIVEEIIERTDGVPLFAEELTKAVMEAHIRAEDLRKTISAAPLAEVAVPATLHASLLGRLDRLGGTVKELAQIGSAVGREFSYELLAVVAQRSNPELHAALVRLTEAGVLFCRGVPPNATFLFKHALIRDAAYASLLRDRRRQRHRRIAETLERHFPDQAEPEVMAHHYAEAQLLPEAIRFWEQAGRKALASSAQAEAAAHLRNAVKLLRQQPESEARDEMELRLLLGLGQALFGAVGGAAPETQAVFSRTRELAPRCADPGAFRRSTYGLFVGAIIGGRLRDVLKLGDELLAFAYSENDDQTKLTALRMLGSGHALMGHLSLAEARLNDAIALFKNDRATKRRGDTFAHNPGQTSIATLAHVRWSRGFPAAAVGLIDDAFNELDQETDANTVSYTMVWAGQLRLYLRQPEKAAMHAADLIRFAHERGSRFWIAVADCIEGASLVERGKPEEGLAKLVPGLSRFAAMGSKQHEPVLRCFEARGLLRLGRVQQCHDCLAKAFRCVEETEQRFYEAEVLRSSAELLQTAGRHTEAQDAYLRAVGVANAQGSRSLELRASISLARLWRDQSKRTEARDLLAPIYGWFTEGFDTPDLKEAKGLLEELSR
jgi:class 3 adenylate cyclase